MHVCKFRCRFGKGSQVSRRVGVNLWWYGSETISSIRLRSKNPGFIGRDSLLHIIIIIIICRINLVSGIKGFVYFCIWNWLKPPTFSWIAAFERILFLPNEFQLLSSILYRRNDAPKWYITLSMTLCNSFKIRLRSYRNKCVHCTYMCPPYAE